MSDPRAFLGSSLTLPCGVTLPNRLAKSAMSEQLGDAAGAPTSALSAVYRRWAEGGAGLVITGNVMVDGRHLGEPHNVVLEDERHLDAFRAWADAARSGPGALWVQLNHPGRQAPRFATAEPVAPSAVPMTPATVFAPPRALTSDEVHEVVARFGRAAGLVRAAGFNGVQIHGAHGYLVSQFLSPRTNQRDDEWGGTPERRRRFVLAVVAAMREAVGPGFPVGIKVNSADFQRGGFTEDEAFDVLQALDDAGVDLIEISGGTYEAPAMLGPKPQKASTQAREAYFLTFAERARERVRTPLMLTGGFRTRSAMEAALASGAIDMAGLARPLCLDPDLPRKLLDGLERCPEFQLQGFGPLTGYLNLAWHAQQIRRMGRGRNPDPHRPGWLAAAEAMLDNGLAGFAPRRI